MRSFLLAAVCSVLCGLGETAQAQRPPAHALLPRSTVAYFSIANAPDLRDRLFRTTMGRMSQDPQLKPLVDDLYGSAVVALAAVQDRLGVSITELLNLPQGELTLAVVAPEESRPAVVVLIDAGERIPVLRQLIDRQSERLVEQGAERSEETIDQVKFVTFEFSGGERRLIFFEKDGTLAAGTDRDVLKQVLAAWNGAKTESLATNLAFSAVARRAGEVAGEPAQVAWFVDPIGFVRSTSDDSGNSRLGLALIPTLGLDGVLGAGGSVQMAGEQYDMVIDMHLFLDTPRTGIPGLLAFGSGDTTPESWVPAEAGSYTTFYWEAETTYHGIAKLYDGFQGNGALAELVGGRIFNLTGLDFEDEVLEQLDGRFTLATWYERPVSLTSQVTLAGVKLKDGEKFKRSIDKMVDHFDGKLEQRSYAGKTYYVYQGQIGRPPREGQEQFRPQPSICLFDNYLLLGDRPSAIEKAIVTAEEPEKSLANDLEYKLIASTIRRQTTAVQPAFVEFNRPEEQMRYLYELALSDSTRQRLEERGERNPFLGRVGQALKDNPLPPFEVLQQYFAPGGAMLIDDESGLHYTSFTLQRK
ncbi:MAG: DUF3352 domain-containing protein [Planctomycetes bacterium]|nr:DUF3352 domain-containing protein [Planctomycetota bacterium]